MLVSRRVILVKKKTDGLSSIPLTSELSDCASSVSTDQLTSETLQPVKNMIRIDQACALQPSSQRHCLHYQNIIAKKKARHSSEVFVLMMFLVEAIKMYCNWKPWDIEGGKNFECCWLPCCIYKLTPKLPHGKTCIQHSHAFCHKKPTCVQNAKLCCKNKNSI